MKLAEPRYDFPDPALVEYVYKGKGKDAPRFMRHLVDSWEYPGITTILAPWDKGGLINWAANVEREACLEAGATVWAKWCLSPAGRGPIQFAQEMEKCLGSARAHVRIKEKAADIGGQAHKRVQWELQGLLGLPRKAEPPCSEEALIAFMAWQDYFTQSGITPLRMEQPVWSHEHQRAGTVDLYGLRDGKLGIVDYKSSKYIYPSHHLQVGGGYAPATEELLGVEVEWAEIWRLPKTLENIKFEMVEVGDMKIWDGEKMVARKVSWQQLYEAYNGIHAGWKLTCPTPNG